MKKAISCKHSPSNKYSHAYQSQTNTVTTAKEQPKCYISISPNFSLTTYLVATIHFNSGSKTVKNMTASLPSNANLRKAFHTQCSSLGCSLIYSQYCTAFKVDSCYFVECSFGLRTIKHMHMHH